MHQRDEPEFSRTHGRQGIAGISRFAGDGGGERDCREDYGSAGVFHELRRPGKGSRAIFRLLMKSQVISRIVSAIFIAVLFGLYMHHDYVVRGQMGRDAYLAKQAARFDRHFANPDPVVVQLIAAVILFGIFFSVYELIVFVLAKIFEKIGGQKGR